MLKVRNTLLVAVVLSVSGAVFVGCSSQEVSQPAVGPDTSAEWKVGLDDDIVTALSELPDADRTAAVAQKVCPVTNEQLGSMGKPLKATVEGQDVFLCCGGCEEELRKDPEKYLAKLKSN